MYTAIIIPTYNERENLPILLARIAALHLRDVEVIVVDDNSPDGTGDAADAMTRRVTGGVNAIRVLHRQRREGLGAALTAGFHDALAHGAEIVVQMDADGSHDPAEIPAMLDRIAQGADIVVGSRRIPGGRIIGWSAHRRLASWGAQWIGRQLLGFRTHDITSGFRAWRANVLRAALATIET